MSSFTVFIIIVAIFQLIVSVLKKNGKQQMPGKLPDPFKRQDGRSIRESWQGTSFGSWKEQLKQALENISDQAGPLKSSKPQDFEKPIEPYIETEGTQGVEGTQGTEGTSEYVGIMGLEAYKSKEKTPSEQISGKPLDTGGLQVSVTENGIIQGIIWAEILGKPRALRPFRGPRS